MAVTFTPEQSQAIELHNCDILVSAAAGSGKTAVLTQRIVEMVCRKEDPVDIDRLLVVTFTNAAAAEMRERISRAILKRLSEDGTDEHLQRQAALLHNAQITTIHSFCLFVLRNNFQDIGLDPSFGIGDEGEMELLRQDVLAALLEERFASGDEAFCHCVEYFCPAGRESMLENHILDLHRHAGSYPFPREWLEERKKDYAFSSEEEIEDSAWGRYLFLHLKRTAEAALSDMRGVQRLCEEPDGPYMYGEIVEEEIGLLEALFGAAGLKEYEERLSAVEFGRLPSKKDESVSPEKRGRARALRDAVKDTLKDVQTRFFSVPLSKAVRQAPACMRALHTLIDLCLEFGERLDGQKREKKLLEFSDLEHMALQILLARDEAGRIVPTATALAYREHFEEVLTDEYQDSNLVQEYLLAAVSRDGAGEKNRFMVGDVKQSIYRFRLARPELFLEKYDRFSRTGESRRIDLHKNFRSRPEVIDTVNEVFSRIMTPALGGIVYDGAAALVAGADYPENKGCESELILFGKQQEESGISKKEQEALGIAGRIKELCRDFKVTDAKTGALRPARYGDMVILLRTGSGWDEAFREVLEREGIPAYVEGRTGYFAAKEIRDVLQFLRVLDNPLQDIPLFGAMKSVFGGFTDEEAAVVRAWGKSREDLLYDCLKGCAKEPDSETKEQGIKEAYPAYPALKEKCVLFLKRIAKFRACTAYMPVRELLETVFDEYCYLPYVAALPAGGKRLANVEMLLAKASVFEKNSYYGLFRFIRYIEQLEKYDVDYGEANTLDEHADAVRIMSIHKSKGLEFPIVFVAGLAKRFNMQDAAQPLVADMDMGIGVQYVDPVLRVKNKTLRQKVLAAKQRLESLAEELRVLYVAMTRAREKLILTAAADPDRCGAGSGGDGGESAAKEGPLSYIQLTSAACFLDYLLPVFPNVTVKTCGEIAGQAFREEVSKEVKRRLLSDGALREGDALLAELLERFSYVYPHGDLARLYTKTTVSELKKAAMEGTGEEPARELFPAQEVQPYIPAFRREKEEVSGAARGSAVHRVMELVDLTAEYKSEAELASAMDAFVADGRLPRQYADAVRPGKILRFLHTKLAGRMRRAQKSGKLFREQPFVYGVDAGRLSRGEDVFPAGETVLIQGIIDVFFEEEDGLVLLDYKTDVIDSPKELVLRYKAQLDYYEEALVNLTGKRVKEKILYSFFLECEVPCQTSLGSQLF